MDETTRELNIKTKAVANPIANPLITASVTASVGHARRLIKEGKLSSETHDVN